MNFDNNLRHRARPILLRQHEVVSVEETTPCLDGPSIKQRLWRWIKYILIVFIIFGILFATAQLSLPYFHRTRLPVRCKHAYNETYNYVTALLSKFLKSTKFLKSDVFYRRKFMKFADVSFKKRSTVIRALSQLPRSLTSRLWKAFAKIFSSSKVDNDASENNIVLNLFGLVAVRKNDNCIQQISILPRVFRPQVSSAFQHYHNWLAASSYNKIKHVLKRCNNIMDLILGCVIGTSVVITYHIG